MAGRGGGRGQEGTSDRPENYSMVFTTDDMEDDEDDFVDDYVDDALRDSTGEIDYYDDDDDDDISDSEQVPIQQASQDVTTPQQTSQDVTALLQSGNIEALREYFRQNPAAVPQVTNPVPAQQVADTGSREGGRGIDMAVASGSSTDTREISQTRPVAQQQQSIFRRSQPAVVATQPRPEYVSINQPVSALPVTKYMSDENVKLWKDFFIIKSLDTEDYFYPLRSFYRAQHRLWHRGFVTLTGYPGDGKTSIVDHMVVSLLQTPPEKIWDKPSSEEKYYWKHTMIRNKPKYEVVRVNSSQDWVTKVKRSKNQIIVIEDMFGGASFVPSLLEAWVPYLDDIHDLVLMNRPKSLIIITLHRHQLDKMHPRFRDHPLFVEKAVIDITSGTQFFDGYERMRLLDHICEYIHGRKQDIEYREQEQIRKLDTKSFGYACQLYAVVKSFNVQGHSFFKNPDRAFEVVLQKVFSFDKVILFTLASLILFDGKLKLDKASFQDYDENEQNVFRQLRIALEIPDDVDLAKMRYACTLLNGPFLKPVQLHQWEIVHERTFYQVCDGLMKKYPKKIIELCSLDFVVHRLRTTTFYLEHLESLCSVWNKDYNELAQRLTFEILKGHVRLIAAHPALGDVRFAEHWAKFIADMGTFSPVVELKGDYNRSLFFWLAYYGNEGAIRFMFKQEEDMEEIKNEDWFKEELNLALFAACTSYNMFGGKMTTLLMNNGATIENAKENLGKDDMILLYGKEIYEVVHKQKGSLLHVACMYGSYETVDSIIQAGADTNYKTLDGNTPAHRAAMNRRDGALKALIKHKADINSLNAKGASPLHEAVRCGNENVLRQLVWNGVEVNKETKMNDGRSLLSVAAGQESEGCMKILIDAMEKPPNPRDVTDPWKALHEAIALGNEKLVKQLLDKDAPYNEKCSGGWSPIHYAALFNYDNIAKMLLEKKADVNALTANKKTPLHIAAENGYFEMCNVLLDYGAKPECMCATGDYPMQLAAKNGHKEIVVLFLREGMELDYGRETYRERDFMMRMMFGGRSSRFRDMFD